MKNSFFDFKIIAAPEPADSKILCVGNGKKGLGIVLQQAEYTPEAQAQLRGILSALKLDLEEDAVCFVLPEGTSVQISALIRIHKLSEVLFFDLPGARCGILFPLPLNKPIRLGTCYFLRAPSLLAIIREKQEGGKTLRLGLWQALQQIFLNT